MILTTGVKFEGYEHLTKHFKVDPGRAMEALELASTFCEAQLCSGCKAGNSCLDCKKNQEKEYQINCGNFDTSNLTAMGQKVATDAIELERIKQKLVRDIKSLKHQMESGSEEFDPEDFEIHNDAFIKSMEKINSQLDKMAKDHNSNDLKERLDAIESNIRTNNKRAIEKPEIEVYNMYKPDRKEWRRKPAMLTPYEKG